MAKKRRRNLIAKTFSGERFYDQSDSKRFRKVAKWVGNSKKVLDVGCFTGVLGEILVKKKNDVYGVDLSRTALAVAEKRGIKVKTGDLEEGIPFKDSFFDVVIGAEVIEHLADTDFFIKEVRRVLKDGGILILTTPNLVSLGRRISYLFGKDGFHEASYAFPPGAGGHLRYFNKGMLTAFLSYYGFKVNDFTSEVVNFLPASKLQSFWLADIFPTLGRSLIVKATKVGKESR